MTAEGKDTMNIEEEAPQQEEASQYLAALESAATYSIQGMMMEMRTAEGAMAATFRRLVTP